MKTRARSKLDRCLANIDVDGVGLFQLFNSGEPLLHPELAAIHPPRAGVLGDLKERTCGEILAGGERAAMVRAMETPAGRRLC